MQDASLTSKVSKLPPPKITNSNAAQLQTDLDKDYNQTIIDQLKSKLKEKEDLVQEYVKKNETLQLDFNNLQEKYDNRERGMSYLNSDNFRKANHYKLSNDFRQR